MECIFQSVFEFILVCVIVGFAQIIYVLFGFGSGLIAVGTLALILPDIKDVVVLLLFINMPAEMLVVFSSIKKITWKNVSVIFIGVLIGIPVGARLLNVSEPVVILTILGIILVAVGIAFLFTPGIKPVQIPKWIDPPTGLISGILSGLFGTGGPPLIIYYLIRGDDKAVFRGNLMAIFLLMTIVRFPSYFMEGLLTTERIWSGLTLIPAVIIGAWLGNRIHINLDESVFQRLVSTALVCIGILLLFQSYKP